MGTRNESKAKTLARDQALVAGIPKRMGSAPFSHTTTGLTATGNQASGIAVYTIGQLHTLRSSTLLAAAPSASNPGGITGLFHNYGAASGVNPSPRDIGTAADLGGNTFGVESGFPGAVTIGAGIFLVGSAPGAQPADGDMFSQCPPPADAGGQLQ